MNVTPPHSSSQALIALGPDSGRNEWHAILHASNQVVLYNPHSHALSVARTPANRLELGVSDPSDPCPYCNQPLPSTFPFPGSHGSREAAGAEGEVDFEMLSSDPMHHSRASDYFQLLAVANETSSRPPSPPISGVPRAGLGRGIGTGAEAGVGSRSGAESSTSTARGAFPAESMAEGYFRAFFQEEYKLGMGANGSVFLCQHLLDGNPLGHFAVKKIAVGESHSYLLKILREVRLLERLHHPNIITYHHAWLETCQFSSFGPKVPTLHVLMQWAEGGSLDDFIDVRLGRKPTHIHVHPAASFPSSPSPSPSGEFSGNTMSPPSNAHPTHTHHIAKDVQPPDHSQSQNFHSRSARIRAFRAYQRAPPEERARMRQEMEGMGRSTAEDTTSTRAEGPERWRAVHLLSAEEVRSLFHDVVEGLAFLHDRSILHLDLKPGNVLLTWDEGRLIPRAMLSDFGTSRDMINTSSRSGNTGTLEYTAPETLPSPHTGILHQIDSKVDVWALGMILHKLLFFKLPYRNAAEGDANLDGVNIGAGPGASKRRESDKLQALENEVRDYPGFKSTPALVTAFEGRRLPRAFLVLLESLLHRTPAGRPAVERVALAIREGKLNPLKVVHTGRNTSLVPVSGRARTESAARIPQTSEGTSKEDHGSSDDSTQVPIHIHHEEGELENVDFSNEKLRLLGPPSPVAREGRTGYFKLMQRWLRKTAHALGFEAEEDYLDLDMQGGRLLGVERKGGTSTEGTRLANLKQVITARRKMLLRLGRSCLLVLKVVTIPSMCEYNVGTSPRPVIVALLLGAALADAVWETDLPEASKARRFSGVRRPSNTVSQRRKSTTAQPEAVSADRTRPSRVNDTSSEDGVTNFGRLWFSKRTLASVGLAIAHFALLRLGRSGSLGSWCCV